MRYDITDVLAHMNADTDRRVQFFTQDKGRFMYFFTKFPNGQYEFAVGCSGCQHKIPLRVLSTGAVRARPTGSGKCTVRLADVSRFELNGRLMKETYDVEQQFVPVMGWLRKNGQ